MTSDITNKKIAIPRANMSEIPGKNPTDQNPQKAKNLPRLSAVPCPECAEGQVITSYCCPKKVNIDCSCGKKHAKLPIEAADIFIRMVLAKTVKF